MDDIFKPETKTMQAKLFPNANQFFFIIYLFFWPEHNQTIIIVMKKKERKKIVGGCGSGIEPVSCYLRVAGRHLAWQPPPSVYECVYEILLVTLDKSVCWNARNVSHVKLKLNKPPNYIITK